jgi:hypothetical protein
MVELLNVPCIFTSLKLMLLDLTLFTLTKLVPRTVLLSNGPRPLNSILPPREMISVSLPLVMLYGLVIYD